MAAKKSSSRAKKTIGKKAMKRTRGGSNPAAGDQFLKFEHKTDAKGPFLKDPSLKLKLGYKF